MQGRVRPAGQHRQASTAPGSMPVRPPRPARRRRWRRWCRYRRRCRRSRSAPAPAPCRRRDGRTHFAGRSTPSPSGAGSPSALPRRRRCERQQHRRGFGSGFPRIPDRCLPSSRRGRHPPQRRKSRRHKRRRRHGIPDADATAPNPYPAAKAASSGLAAQTPIGAIRISEPFAWLPLIGRIAAPPRPCPPERRRRRRTPAPLCRRYRTARWHTSVHRPPPFPPDRSGRCAPGCAPG